MSVPLKTCIGDTQEKIQPDKDSSSVLISQEHNPRQDEAGGSATRNAPVQAKKCRFVGGDSIGS
jgi:hypothetical protein